MKVLKRTFIILLASIIITSSVTSTAYAGYEIRATGVLEGMFVGWTIEQVIAALCAVVGVSYVSTWDVETISDNMDYVRESMKEKQIEFAQTQGIAVAQAALDFDNMINDALGCGILEIPDTVWGGLKAWANDLKNSKDNPVGVMPTAQQLVDIVGVCPSTSGMLNTINYYLSVTDFLFCRRTALGIGYIYFIAGDSITRNNTTFTSNNTLVSNTVKMIRLNTEYTTTYQYGTITLSSELAPEIIYITGTADYYASLSDKTAGIKTNLLPSGEFVSGINNDAFDISGLNTLVSNISTLDNYDFIGSGSTVQDGVIVGDRTLTLPDQATAEGFFTGANTITDVMTLTDAIPVEVATVGTIALTDNVLDWDFTDAGTQEEPVTVDESVPAIVTADIPKAGSSIVTVFPFCIPFDLVHCFNLLTATPEAPRFEWVFDIPSLDYSYTFVLDLEPFSSVAKIFRLGETLLFIGALILATRKLIKG